MRGGRTGYAGASATSVSLLRWWFETEHLLENADGSLSPFRYYFAQREAVETLDLALRRPAGAATSSTCFASTPPAPCRPACSTRSGRATC